MYVPQTSYTLQPVYTGDIKGSIRKLSYTNPYDIVIKAKSLDVDGGPKSALHHLLNIYNYNNPKPLPVSF